MDVRIKIKVPATVAELQHKGEHFFHMTYLGAVGWEAHGLYKIAAIIACVFAVAGVFISRELVEEVENVSTH